MAKSKKEYITYTIIIFNSFFEYGFLRRQSSSGTSTFGRGTAGGGGSSYNDEWADSGENPLSKTTHYWEYIT